MAEAGLGARGRTRVVGADALVLGGLAAVVYVPLLLTARGQVAADSKQLLFVDASRYLSRVPYLWDPTIGLGTVTHQNLGYLFPVGPFFWLTHQLGLPVWVSQRLWLGTLLFGAGTGVWFLTRTLRWHGAGPAVAAFAYALTPFTFQYSTHLSVLLLPYAVLPWLVACTVRAVRAGGWRWPAWFALGVAVAGTINATALACVLIGPAVVLGVAWAQTRATRRVLAATGRIVVLSAVVSVWWAVALWVEGRYGVDFLRFSESLETVTVASSAPEVLRGLGYWFFYGRDARGPYLDAARPYMADLPVLAVSFLPAFAGVAAAWVVRWRARGAAVASVVVATVLAVGAHPFAGPSPYGAAFKWILQTSDAAQALRSITRVGPVLVLGLALLLGAGVHAVVLHARTLGRAVAAAAVVLVLVVAWPLYRGDAVSSNRVRPEAIPAYWEAVARTDGPAGTRTLELPGIDFAAYDWGFAHDSVTPGLTDRPTVAREVVAWGGPAAIDLLQAFDGRAQQRVLDPAGVAAMARLLSAGTIVWRGDLDTGRYELPDPDVTRAVLDAAPGLGHPTEHGDGALARYPVDDARPLERAESARGAVIVSGSGDGLVDLAEAGLLPDDALVVYSGTLADRPDVRRRLLRDGAWLVVTDTNRRRATRTKSLFGNEGYTERVGETPLRRDEDDSRDDLFPAAGDDARTVTVVDGPSARATSYGNPVWLVPAARPMLAVDGDPTTAWRTGDFWRTKGERIEVDAGRRVRADHVTLLQAPGGNRSITRVRLTFDGRDAFDVELGRASRTGAGQRVDFGARTFRTLGVEVLATDPPDRPNNGGLDGVGFAEIEIPGVGPAVELVRLPRDLLARSDDHPLTIVMTRQRQAALPASRTPTAVDAAELRLARQLDLPRARSFTLQGTARPADGAATPAPGCRTDLLTVDGAPLPVALAPAPDGTAALATCDGAPVTLAAGTHRVLAADGRTTGVHVDRLVLDDGARRAAPSASVPRVEVLDRGPTSIRLRVRDAAEPFWLVLGQSHNDGWRAETPGGDLGAPLLVDGFANGWYVRPTAGTFDVTLRWTPQRVIWWGIAVSAVGLLACVVLVVAGRRPGTVLGGDGDGRVTARPGLAGPDDWRPPARASATGSVVAVVLAGAAGALFVAPWAGVVTAAAAFAAQRLRFGRAGVAVTSLALLASSVVYIVVRQRTERFADDFAWPASFDAVHRVALLAIVLLGIDAALRRWRER